MKGVGGRKKKPIVINHIEGYPHHGRKIQKIAPLDMLVPSLGAVYIPVHLHQDAQDCIQVIKDSMPDALYSRADTFSLASFACAWAVHMKAAHELANPEFDWIITNGQGNKAGNPWIKIMFEAGKQMATLGDRLGLNPSARASLKMPGVERAQRDTSLDLLELNESSSSLSDSSQRQAA
jgi:phage terminase small subunit